MKTKDNFSAQSSEYLKYRFGYPDSFIRTLASFPAKNELVWDVGCGNGQAAIGLANYFNHVVATDISSKQIENAIQHPAINYQIRDAQASGLPDASVDLITVAQALHWFEIEPFYDEVRRVLKPDGAIAVWCYTLPTSRPEIDSIINNFYHQVLKTYWAPCMSLVNEKYTRLPFPFHQIEIETFTTKTEWTFADMLGHLSSWSAVREFQQQNGYDPFAAFHSQLQDAWDDLEQAISFEWPLHVKVGRIDNEQPRRSNDNAYSH